MSIIFLAVGIYLVCWRPGRFPDVPGFAFHQEKPYSPKAARVLGWVMVVSASAALILEILMWVDPES